MTRGFMLAMLATGMAVSSFAALPEHVAQAQQKAIAHLRADVPDVLFFKEGDKLSRVWGVKFAFGSSPRGSADQFIAEYAGMFAEDEGTFQFERTQDVMNGLFTAVYFKEVASGRVLEGAGLTILVKNEAGFPIVLAASRKKLDKTKQHFFNQNHQRQFDRV